MQSHLPTMSQHLSAWAAALLGRLLREASTDKLLIEEVSLRYCHAAVRPRDPPLPVFDLHVLFETATILDRGAQTEKVDTVDGRMMFAVQDTTEPVDIEIEVEVPDSLSKADERSVVTEVRRLGPAVHALLHKKFVPALLKEAAERARAGVGADAPNTDMRAWLRLVGLVEYFDRLAQEGVDLAALKEMRSGELQRLGLPSNAGFVIRNKVEEEREHARLRADMAAGGESAETLDGLTDDDVKRASMLRSHFGPLPSSDSCSVLRAFRLTGSNR